MKDDMSGGAAVACAMRAIALLNAPMRVVGVVPATENMPGGRAIKPGDILTSAAGKTVEVINTDAEGRLILGDGLWYARRLGATHLVDVATLTGAVVVALGKVTSGLFGNSDAWVDTVRRVTGRAGDRVWPMPLFDDYREQIKSEIADMTNTGRTWAACREGLVDPWRVDPRLRSLATSCLGVVEVEFTRGLDDITRSAQWVSHCTTSVV
jgi:leucyl aminopeptidase